MFSAANRRENAQAFMTRVKGSDLYSRFAYHWATGDGRMAMPVIGMTPQLTEPKAGSRTHNAADSSGHICAHIEHHLTRSEDWLYSHMKYVHGVPAYVERDARNRLTVIPSYQHFSRNHVAFPTQSPARWLEPTLIRPPPGANMFGECLVLVLSGDFW
jgi:hypothetical protein